MDASVKHEDKVSRLNNGPHYCPQCQESALRTSMVIKPKTETKTINGIERVVDMKYMQTTLKCSNCNFKLVDVREYNTALLPIDVYCEVYDRMTEKNPPPFIPKIISD